ncbi:hypothetical protein IWZ03DRAFT_37874 [Phyllosticta citriasiana]|uniref:Uncharacterized protein n=1 Tax=Phyllosticta citriasiana TaxID=595635 RepID=A0ABR1KDV6_9PEZI
MPDTMGHVKPGNVYHIEGQGDYQTAPGDGVLPDIACSRWTKEFAPIIGSFPSLEVLILDTTPYRGMGLPFSRSLLSHVVYKETPVMVRVEFQTYVCEFFWKGFKTTTEVTFKPKPRLQGSQRHAIYSDTERLSTQLDDFFEKLSMAYFDQGPSTVRFKSLDMAGMTIFSLCHEYLKSGRPDNRPPLYLSLRGIRERTFDEDDDSDEVDEEDEELFGFKMDGMRTILEELSRSERIFHELSIVDCRFAKTKQFLVSVFKRLRKQHDHIKTFRFEKVRDLKGRIVKFDWDGDGQMDDGSRVPALVEELGVRQTLGRMVECVRC